jgi:hypothetical protein
MAKLDPKAKEKAMAINLGRRIVEIDGQSNWRDIQTVIDNLESREGDELWNETDTLEGGIEEMFNVECPSCFRTQAILLPFEPAFFTNRGRFAHSRQSMTG